MGQIDGKSKQQVGVDQGREEGGVAAGEEGVTGGSGPIPRSHAPALSGLQPEPWFAPLALGAQGIWVALGAVGHSAADHAALEVCGGDIA